MLIVGLTGGIGSGKSVVSDLFESFGVDVLDADVAAREVVKPGKPSLYKIEEHFGKDILTSRGELNRRKLREIIFSNESEKLWLEACLHPVIEQHLTQEMKSCSGPYTLLVSPLLLETQQYNLCSRILVIDVLEELQIKRACERDKVDEAQVKEIILSQKSREDRLIKADDVLTNNGSLEELRKDVFSLHENYLKLCC